MGYDVKIVRNGDVESSDISLNEWLELVDRDAELSNTKENQEWVTWSKSNTEQEHWFEWVDGYLWTKDIDNSILQKMLKIASELGCDVVGEEGEIFHTADIKDGFTHAINAEATTGKSTWEKWRKTIWPYLGIGFLLYVAYKIFL